MKQVIAMGIMVVLFMTVLTACGNLAESDPSQEVQDMVSNTMGNLYLTYYSNIVPDMTVEITNYMKEHAASGDTIFYDIYTDEEKAADPAKEDTGLFFFKGNGLGIGTVAGGWLDEAIAFWQRQVQHEDVSY